MQAGNKDQQALALREACLHPSIVELTKLLAWPHHQLWWKHAISYWDQMKNIQGGLGQW
jgi:hypothetical protein